MCYWNIIQRSCQDHPKVTQGQNGKNNINIHFFAFVSSFSTADIYAYYGLDPFPMYNYFLGLIIDDNGKYIQKLSDGILSRSSIILQQVKVWESVRPLSRVILTGKFISA